MPPFGGCATIHFSRGLLLLLPFLCPTFSSFGVGRRKRKFEIDVVYTSEGKKDGREFTLGRESLATAPFWGFDIFEWLMRRRISSSSFLVSRFLFIFIDSLMIAFCV